MDKKIINDMGKSGQIKYGMSISPKPYLRECYKRYGKIGYTLALELMNNQIDYQNFSPWYNIRRVE